MPSLLRFLMAMTFNFGGKVRPAFGLQSRFEIGGGQGNRPTPLFFGDLPQFLYTNTFLNWFGIL